MNIYLSNETNFQNNGIGFLFCLSAKVYEILNGDMYLQFTCPLNSNLSEYLVEDNIVKCKTENGTYQLFRISQVSKNFKTINIYAFHITYDLAKNFLLDTAPTNLDCQNFGRWILDHTNYEHNFTFESDITAVKSARYVRRNPIEAIMGDLDNSMLKIFGGDIERDNFKIKLKAFRGSTTPKKLIFGKNIKDIKISIDNSSVYTRILPIGFDGLLLPEKYVDSPLIDTYTTPKIGKIEFSDIKFDEEDEQAYHTEEEAYQALRDAVNELYNQEIDKPSINIKIDWLELSKTKEYYEQYNALEAMHLGDVVYADILGVYYQTRIIKTEYNVLTDRIDKFEVGSVVSTIQSSINLVENKVESIEPSSILAEAKNSASNQIKTALGGYVYKTQSELFIMDTDNINTAQKVWRWNLNGLAYSDNGVNGDYETAITQDGEIVANFITTGSMSAERIYDLNSIVTNLLNIQIESGAVNQVKTTNGFTFDSDGLNIYTNENSYNVQINNVGTYCRDGNTILTQTTKDGTITKDMVLYGRYYYGVDPDLQVEEFTKDKAMFVSEKFVNSKNEVGFGHFYNGGY